MEGRGLQDKDHREGAYRIYQPESFDAPDAARSQPRAQLPPVDAAFEQGSAGQAESTASFEGRPQEEAEQTDFASIKFQRENTLLTNAESYANSIREEAQLYVRQLRSEVEALNQQSEKRYEEAEQVKKAAEAEAEGVMAEAKGQLEEIRQQAHQEGFEAGQKEGLARRYEEASGYLERLESILAELQQFRRRVAFYTEKDGIRLALLIAKKILHTELKINKQAVLKLLASTLAKLQGKGTFQVWLNPDDHRFVSAARPSLERFLDEEQALTLRAKPDLPPGNVLIETDREMIDLTFESQFYHLERLLNQTLSEREAALTQARPDARATAPARGGTGARGTSGSEAAPSKEREADGRTEATSDAS